MQHGLQASHEPCSQIASSSAPQEKLCSLVASGLQLHCVLEPRVGHRDSSRLKAMSEICSMSLMAQIPHRMNMFSTQDEHV